METEQQVQRLLDLQNIANNLPHVFTNYKGVVKSFNLARNVPERVKVPKKTTQIIPLGSKRGRDNSLLMQTLLVINISWRDLS
jgi:hypothetical protein